MKEKGSQTCAISLLCSSKMNVCWGELLYVHMHRRKTELKVNLVTVVKYYLKRVFSVKISTVLMSVC